MTDRSRRPPFFARMWEASTQARDQSSEPAACSLASKMVQLVEDDAKVMCRFMDKRWDAACAKARQIRPWPRDEQDALALVYYPIATREAVEVEGISTQAVRYQIDNPFVLQQHLTELIPGPRSGHTTGATEVMAERARTRLAEADADANSRPVGGCSTPGRRRRGRTDSRNPAGRNQAVPRLR